MKEKKAKSGKSTARANPAGKHLRAEKIATGVTHPGKEDGKFL